MNFEELGKWLGVAAGAAGAAADVLKPSGSPPANVTGIDEQSPPSSDQNKPAQPAAPASPAWVKPALIVGGIIAVAVVAAVVLRRK